MDDERINGVGPKNRTKISHYYGDTVRSLYILMAAVMLVVTPFVLDELPFPAFSSIFAVLVLSILAGFTNPKTKHILFVDFIVSIVALLYFGHEMIVSYSEPHTRLFFFTNLFLAVSSLFVLYFSSKTLRGNVVS